MKMVDNCLLLVLCAVILPFASTEREFRRKLLYTTRNDKDAFTYVIVSIVIFIIALIIKCCKFLSADASAEAGSAANDLHPPPRTFSNPGVVPVLPRGGAPRTQESPSAPPPFVIPVETVRVQYISIENPNYFAPKPEDDLPPSYDSVVREGGFKAH